MQRKVRDSARGKGEKREREKMRVMCAFQQDRASSTRPRWGKAPGAPSPAIPNCSAQTGLPLHTGKQRPREHGGRHRVTRASDFELIITFRIWAITLPEKNPTFGSRMAKQWATYLKPSFKVAEAPNRNL